MTVADRLGDPRPEMTMLLVHTSAGFDDVATTVRLPAGVSASPTTKLIGLATPFIGMVRSGRSVMVGALLDPLTVTVNVRITRLFTMSPSFTVTVMVAVPIE